MDMNKVADAIIEEAKGFGFDCFVFGDEVYTLEEAKEAIVAYGEDEINERFSGDVDAYKQHIVECADIK